MQYALALTEFVSHCISNASPYCLQKKSVSCMVALMSHFLMKEQDFAYFSYFFVSSHCTPFPLQWSFFSIGLSLLPFLLTGLPLSEKKTQRGSPWHFSFFIFPYVLLPHSSISLFLSTVLLSPRSTISSFRRCAVQSCSKSRVCSCWSSSIFLRLLDPGVLSCRISQNRRKGDKSRGRRPKDVARESADLSVLPQC